MFSIPLFRRVPEPPPAHAGPRPLAALIAAGFGRLGGTLRDLRGYRHAFLLLLAFLLYNDGIQTIIRMGAAFGVEIGISTGALITAIIMIQFVGVPFALLFGFLAAGWASSEPCSSRSRCTSSWPSWATACRRPPTSSSSPSWWPPSRAAARASAGRSSPP